MKRLTKKQQEQFEAEQEIRLKYRDECERRPERNALHLACILGRYRPELQPHLVALDAAKLWGMGRQIAALAVAQCNYGLTDRQEKRREKLSELCKTIAGWYGLTAETFGDPRGYVVRLHGRNIPKNGWGDGFGVA